MRESSCVHVLGGNCGITLQPLPQSSNSCVKGIHSLLLRAVPNVPCLMNVLRSFESRVKLDTSCIFILIKVQIICSAKLQIASLSPNGGWGALFFFFSVFRPCLLNSGFLNALWCPFYRLHLGPGDMDSSSFIQFDVPEYGSSVLSQLNELRLQGKLCDIVVHIQGQPFRAHKAVLAASSPYFRDHSALNTMSGLSISVIKNPGVFEQLLSFCYTGRMSLQLKDVVSFLTAASFLQMQCVIDKCTQILESIHSKISVGEVDAVTIGEDPLENHNGMKESGYFANPVEISPPPYCAQGRPAASGNDLRMETVPANALRGRLQEEGHSDRGSSGSVSEYEIQVEGDHEQAELIIRESQAAEVKVKMEKSDRPSCSDSSSLGDDGYHTEMVDGEQVVAINVGSYGSVLQNAFSYSQGPPQPANVSESFSGLRSSGNSRSMLGSYRGRGRQKRVSASHLHSDVSSQVPGADSEASAHQPGYESGPRERNSRGHWYAYSERLICIYCGKSFNQKGSLDRHMRLHMGITPFVCKYCGKKYTRKDQLEYHIRGHTDDKPFRCEVCGKCFPFQGTLNQHLRKNHPGVAEIRSRVESPERTEVYMEQRDDDASAPETLDYTMDVHTPD